jgi:hypothetical protein
VSATAAPPHYRMRARGVGATATLLAGAAAFALACGGAAYVEPTAGPAARLVIASTCVERATFFARIDGLRTQELGCNQTGTWRLAPGRHEVTVQARQASYQIEPLTVSVDLRDGECAAFLLRQASGFELVALGDESCE